MTTTPYLTLQDIINNAYIVDTMPSEVLAQYKNYLNVHLKYIWAGLVNNTYTELGSWLLNCRAAVMGFQCMFDSVEEFSEEVYRICSHEGPTLEIPKLDIYIHITSLESFQAAIIYGFNHCVQMSRKKNEMKLEKLFQLITVHSRRETRFTHYYLKMLVGNVENGIRYPMDTYYNSIFKTIYYNLENKDASVVFSKILNKAFIVETNFLLQAVTHHMLWKNKQKYVLMHLILSNEKNLTASLNNNDLVAGLIYAQSKPHLSSYGAKLFNLIIENISPTIWYEEIFTDMQRIIAVPGVPTFCHKNILKNYMPSDENFCNLYLEHVLDIYIRLPEPPLYTILTLTTMGLKYSVFKDCYNFNEIIELAWNTPNEQNRVLLFEIMCSTLNINRMETYMQIKQFIIYNINDVQAASRDSIKKSYTQFLQRIEHVIIKLKNITNDEPIVLHSSNFFNWLITFLLDQFNSSSNYARITISFILFSVSLNSFLNERTKVSENIINYRKLINISEWCTIEAFLNILEVTDEGSTEQVIALIMKYVDFESVDYSKLILIGLQAYNYMSNTNKDIAEKGKKIIQLSLQIENLETEHLQKIKNVMIVQWQCFKYIDHENLTKFQPLHCLLSLINSVLAKYSVTEIYEIYNVVQDIINNVCKLFASYIMKQTFNNKNDSGLSNVSTNGPDFQNCSVNLMWLTLKESCKLIAKIVNVLKNEAIMCQSLNILYNVIRRCYHKGVLEEAGSVIEEIVASATKNHYNESTIGVFVTAICNAIPASKYVPSTVRRAAETRFVLTAIACGDKRHNKPFLHEIVRFLIKTLKECIDGSNLIITEPYVVQSLCLHCLEPIIVNNSVELHTLEYLSELAILALIHFEINKWMVRNAALQTFSSITRRMVGTSSSNNENIVCLEEIIFKYPTLFQYINKKICEGITNQRMENLIPILTFLSLSDTRADILMLKERNYLHILSQKILLLINTTTNLNLYNVAAKAYAALCDHDRIEKEIDDFYDRIQNTNNSNINFAVISIIKHLFLKLLDCAETACVGKYNKKDILNKMDEFISKTSEKNFCLKTISSILLYRPDLKSIQENDITNLIECVYIRRNDLFNFPGFWETAVNIMFLLITENGIYTAVKMTLSCIELKLPANTTAHVLKLLEARIAHKQDEQEYCSKTLTLTLYNTLLQNYKERKYFADQCIKIILRTGIINVPFNVQEKLINDMYNYPDYFYPLFCLVWENFCYRQQEMDIFFNTCIKRCIVALKLENPDTLVIKSVKYIYKYGVERKNGNVIYKSLKLFYQMLQRDEEDIKQECHDMSLNYLFFKNTHIYAIMMQLLDKDTLIKLLNVHYALILSIEIYCERTENDQNVLQKQPKLAIDTHIVRHVIYNNILELVKKITDFTEFRFWFNEYVVDHQDNQYLIELQTSIAELKNPTQAYDN